MTSSVAIIGAGPSGLALLRAFQLARDAGTEVPELICFEKQTDIGGLWNLTWRTGLDEFGEPVHSSMYPFLWSNGPKECLEFADYTFEEHFGRAIPSFPPREVLYDYIAGRAELAGARAHIRFATAVRDVQWDEMSQKFVVVSENLRARSRTTSHHDQVVVASGHYSVPNAPSFPGIDDFPGRVIHAHDFRDARAFRDQQVLIIGASYSAEDIALQCHKYGAASVTTCYRTRAMGFRWPDGVDERPLLTGLDGATATFKDGSTKMFDAVILCTGYQHHFPFLDDSLKLVTPNRLHPPDVYKGVAWINNPRLFYLGMQDQFYTFSMFDLQAWWTRDVILGRIELPDIATMRAESEQWLAREETLSDVYEQIHFQADYLRELAKVVDYPPFDIALTDDMFCEWEHDKDTDITTYRDKVFTSPVTGTVSPGHPVSWLDALDDSLTTFLGHGN